MSMESTRSDNSAKRSFNNNRNSASSNSNSNPSNKKKKTSQKTLGVAWGSNSRSSSRSSFSNSPFSNFGSYMVEKNRKLQNQFEAEASTSSHGGSGSVKPIFDGVSIFVDGFTVPSSQELRGYMLKHGGRFENYFSRRRVTHIICSNLPDSKIKNLRSFSRGLPVVKPAWILESVAANKLLSWVPYQLDQLANNQPKLSSFFTLKRSSVSNSASTHAPCQVNPEAEDSSLKVGTSGDTYFSEVSEPFEHRKQISRESDDLVNENSNASLVEEIASSSGKPCEVAMGIPSNIDAEDESSVKNDLQSSHYQPAALVSSNCINNQNMKGSPSSMVSEPSNQSHSTLGDPNFVENYFKNSRLHFIGTWRNRYRKRFHSLSNGFNCTSSNIKASPLKTAVMHVDMDCFFVSVVIRNHPELRDKPVAVCHSDNTKGTAEISSANYPARDYGIKAGMFVRNAKALCPHLVIFPYNFEAYEEVADQFYNVLHKHGNKVQAVSCDEAFLDVTESEGDPQLLASKIRKEIFETTRCTASVGIAGNMLMARLATRTAKPDGQCYIPPERVDDYLSQLPIKALPGIGHVLEEKLKKQNVWTCGQLRMISKDSLQKDFGLKTGEMLWNYSRGLDNRLVGLIQESKSVGAEVNWGVRFKDVKDAQNFLSNLCKEVSLRLQGCGVEGRTFTLKIKKRRKDAEEPIKYMGHGDCENLSHSTTVPVATDDVEVLQRITKQLFGFFHLDVKEIRGVGLQVSRLESTENSKQGLERNSLKSWLTSASARTEELCKNNYVAKESSNQGCEGKGDETLGQLCGNSVGLSIQMDSNTSNGAACLNEVSVLPPLCHLDMGVLKSLPPELFSELNEIYGGKLVDLIAKNKGKTENINHTLSAYSHEKIEGAMKEGQAALLSSMVFQNEIPVENKAEQHIAKEVPSVSGAESFVPASGLKKTDLIPSSLSQVDTAVLQQLPEELKVDILEHLPAHRMQVFSPNVLLDPTEIPLEALGTKTAEKNSGSKDFVLDNNLWVGIPPQWVDKFKVSNCLILNILAEMYYKSGSTGNLSPILQRISSVSLHQLDAFQDGWDEAMYILCLQRNQNYSY
ncbi:DNA repair protein REV1 isoform X2 [Quercus robur]|uniref:DNA repair protein REV1 isoform X2 n=1 Tax=Quercus robur TaxID=38942 RepID=UPI0021634A7B|nr:DNA repair protein REV1 isoform X2 [Quercus robur]XP_050260602.1 DNA repair protein REV1 isoform X2 [Quercus robur]